MLLLIDVGNTNITLGVSADGELTHDWRLSCRTGMTSDEFWVVLSSLLAPENITAADIDGIAMSSVVPGLSPVIESAVHQQLNAPFVNVTF